MGSPEYPAGRPRELQGPRPAPLKVRKDSHKIKKPPLAPAPAHPAAAALLQQQQQRGPVIIYTVSPKVIHANPGEFMTLVQRLTGSTSSAADTDPPSAACGGGGALSPAARMATYERSGREQRKWVGGGGGGSGMEGMDYQWDVGGGGGGSGMEGMNYQWDVGGGGQAVGQCFPGILSPAPSSLPPVSPNLFSPSSFDLSFLQDLMMSPAAAAAVFPASGGGNRFGDGGGFLASPGNFLSTPILPSPGTLRDLFNQLDGP